MRWVLFVVALRALSAQNALEDPMSAIKADVSAACASLHKQCRKCTSTIGCGYCMWNSMCISTSRNCTGGSPPKQSSAVCTDALNMWERAATAGLLVIILVTCCFCGCCIACCRALK
eukprot:Gregarina_sp_Poly_1__7503@NODE_418_length_8694_cov_183_956300_g340_i0_p9_GENE_NODE_418_length_8694_cov_183_956300_g340_i0NODE_418_length_8694_cov_183_956300_g340_i0_p9_ORF_typecomplete_len117_score7_41DUF5437/PF17505_2/0_17DUF5437/PF17505_2/5_9e03_NODE_418_length_8694_cov_183_956300_g340_i038714221